MIRILWPLLATALLISLCACQPVKSSAPTPSATPCGGPTAVFCPAGTEDGTQPAQTAQPAGPFGQSEKRGSLGVDKVDILTSESNPPQYSLQVKGSLPTPCHKFNAEVAKPDNKNQIVVTLFSTVDPSQICAQVLSPFNETVQLGSYPAGAYTVLVNSQPVGKIVAP